MGYGLPIIILTLCLSYALYLADMPSPFTEIAGVFQGDAFQGTMTEAGQATGQSAATTEGNPNPYTLFARAFSALFSFITFPITIWFTPGLPTELTALLSVVFLALYSIALISWFKGGDTP